MSLLDFYSELFPGNLATWMIGGTVLLGIIIFVGSFFEKSSLFRQIILVVVLWFLSPAIYWISKIILGYELLFVEYIYILLIIISAYLFSTEKVMIFISDKLKSITKKYDSSLVDYMILPFALASAGLLFFLRFFIVPVGTVLLIGQILQEIF